jgi:alpha-beta hydrolase superfamily lysophospholipase
VKQTPVVLIHGAWFHMSSWEGWAERFTSHGYAVCVPGWPGEAPTADRVRRDPGPLRDLGLATLTAHYEKIVRSFDNPPVLIGHSAGGLIAQHLLGAGLGRAAVALAPLPAGGVPLDNGRPRSWSLMSAGSTRHPCFEPLPRTRFRHVVANAVGDEEAAKLFDRYAVPAPLGLLADLGLDRIAAGPVDTAVDTANSARGPLLLVSGQEDRMVPDAVTRSVYKLYGDSSAVTDLKQFADRGHSLVFDSGWRSVADHVLAWLAANGVEAVAARN